MSLKMAEHLQRASQQGLLSFAMIYIAVSLLVWFTDIVLGSVFFFQPLACRPFLHVSRSAMLSSCCPLPITQLAVQSTVGATAHGPTYSSFPVPWVTGFLACILITGPQQSKEGHKLCPLFLHKYVCHSFYTTQLSNTSFSLLFCLQPLTSFRTKDLILHKVNCVGLNEISHHCPRFRYLNIRLPSWWPCLGKLRKHTLAGENSSLLVAFKVSKAMCHPSSHSASSSSPMLPFPAVMGITYPSVTVSPK